MHLPLLFSVFTAIAAATSLLTSEPEPGLHPLKPRAFPGAKSLFKRQQFQCFDGQYCYTDGVCCSTGCCYGGTECNSNYQCQTVNTCSSSETTCGTDCCSIDQICDYSSDTCSDKPHKPKTSTSTSEDSAAKRLPGKVIGGIVVGVLAAIGLLGAGVLWLFGCCFGKKKKAADGAEEQPPVYGGDNKVPEPQVHEVPPESK